MIKVVWPDEATHDLDAIIAYIEQFDTEAALKTRKRLFDLGESLASSPHRGRPVSRGARELVTVSPYILRYRMVGEDVVILRIRHSRRRPLDR